MGPECPASNPLGADAVAGPKGHALGNVDTVEVAQQHFVGFAAELKLSRNPIAVTLPR